MKLYYYEHCPYCTRVRLIAGLQNIKFEPVILANDDIEGHLNRIGQKQVPFLELDNGNYITESLEICHYLDQKNSKPLLPEKLLFSKDAEALANLLNKASKSLVYPRFLTHELNQQDFPTQSAKDYFTDKKEPMIGDFKATLRFPQKAIDETQNALTKLTEQYGFSPFINGSTFTADDVLLFPILRNLTIIGDLIEIPQKVNTYLNNLMRLSGIQDYRK